MSSPVCDMATDSSLKSGNVLLKFISPNDVGITGSHQCGFYLPKPVWNMYTSDPPNRGTNAEHPVRITWQDGRVTNSIVKWYGRRTRSEYRLTRFGRDFPWLAADTVGDLLVLVLKSLDKFDAFVLYLEDDIIEIQSTLGVEIVDSWGIYQAGSERIEARDECIDRCFREFAADISDFPSGDEFSQETHRTLNECIRNFLDLSNDEALMKCVNAEYRLFRIVERQICQSEIARLFRSVDDFLKTAASIMNRRKARAGRSFENHFHYILKREEIPHDVRPSVDGKPDIIIPGKDAYEDQSFPLEKLYIIGVKTTCKDRWRQVLNEAKRIPKKHILTIQKSISSRQLDEMYSSNVQLIVPKALHEQYPENSNMQIMNVANFINHIREGLN